MNWVDTGVKGEPLKMCGSRREARFSPTAEPHFIQTYCSIRVDPTFHLEESGENVVRNLRTKLLLSSLQEKKKKEWREENDEVRSLKSAGLRIHSSLLQVHGVAANQQQLVKMSKRGTQTLDTQSNGHAFDDDDGNGGDGPSISPFL